MADWSQLLPELLLSISRCLTLNADYVRFRAVCMSWRASTSYQTPSHFPPQIPWLILPQGDSNTCQFFDVSSNKIHNLDLPETRNRSCCGSSHGWLITTHEDLTVRLVNPLTRAQIPLPSLTSFPFVRFDPPEVWLKFPWSSHREFRISPAEMRDVLINKAILSASPGSTNDFVVVATVWTWDFLAFCRPRDEKWTLVSSPGGGYDTEFVDIVCLEGQFYVIDVKGMILTFDVQGPSVELRPVLSIQRYAQQCEYHFVKLDGELLLLRALFCSLYNPQYFRGFELFRLNVNGQPVLVELKNIGDRILFFGVTNLFSLHASEFPDLKGNCIYFIVPCPLTVDSFGSDVEAHLDLRSFNLRDNSVEHLYPRFKSFLHLSNWWVTPCLC